MIAADPPFTCPKVIANYSLESYIGSGSFAFVYQGRNINKGEQIVAMKIIPKSYLEKDDYQKIQREIKSMQILSHKNIVRLLDFFENPNYFFLITEYCEGGSLFNYILQGKPLREPQAAIVFRQIVEAIDYCHSKGIAHRDLKPQNILFTQFPNIKITDFGLCGFITPEKKMNTFCGTPCYSAPECLNHCSYDGKSVDIWSLGVILYELVTFNHPWNVANVSQMLSQITHCKYTIPPYVTSACSDLIESILKLDDRLPCEDILCHPWMKLAQRPEEMENQKSSLPLLRKTNTANDVSLGLNFHPLKLPVAKPATKEVACHSACRENNKSIITKKLFFYKPLITNYVKKS